MSMNLTAELFNAIISSLKSDGTSSYGGHEKRKGGRVGLRCSLEIVPSIFGDNGAKPLSIYVHDLSIRGLGFVSSVKLTLEMEFEAKLSRDGLPPVPVLYRLKHYRALSRHLYAGGAEFLKVLPDSSGQVMSMGRVAKAKKKPPAAPESVETTPATV